MSGAQWFLLAALVVDFGVSVWLSVSKARKAYTRGLKDGWDKAIICQRGGLILRTTREIES
jgi:hypothetical protein